MAKVLKSAAIVVGVVAAGFVTAGAAWAVAGGAALGTAVATTAAFGIGGVSLSTIIAGSQLVAGIAGAFDKPSSPTVGTTDAGTQAEFKADPRAPLPYGMGRTGTGGRLLIDMEDNGHVRLERDP